MGTLWCLLALRHLCALLIWARAQNNYYPHQAQPVPCQKQELPTSFGQLVRVLLFQKPQSSLKLYGRECMDMSGCVYKHFSREVVFGFITFSLGFLPQEKSRTATLSGEQHVVQNLDPANHPLKRHYPSYRQGLACMQSGTLIHICPCSQPAPGQGATQKEGALLQGLRSS